jgi:uncharacterized membrane protein YhaH (DUF805 family)
MVRMVFTSFLYLYWLVVECVVYCRRLQGSGGWWTLLLYLGVVSKLHTLNGLVGEFSCCSELQIRC